MSIHRVCCGVTNDQPRLVRGGWYHFIVLSSCGTPSVFVGVPQQTTVGEECQYETVPGAPPPGHPLAVPAAVLEKRVIDVEAGAYHCVVRHDDHTIACWGLNTMGQCNVPTSTSKGDLTDPNNANLRKIVGLHAGYSTTAISFNDGTIVAWGDPEVCDVLNQWTDIVMSPPPPRLDPEVGIAPNVTGLDASDANKPQYHSAALDGAYDDSEETVTYNLHIDRLGEWHSGQKPCLPMFDLGVETDPHLPMEFNPERATALPSINVQFPRRDPANPDPYTDAFLPECNCEDVDGPWSTDYIEKCWRDFIFSASPEYGVKSCCDLEVKRDFAVAIRRTGQIVTTRSNNRDPSCPAGQTSGASQCRDCTADSYLSVTSGAINHDLGNGNTLSCQCDANRRFFYSTDGSTGMEACVALPSPPFPFGQVQAWLFEGIGCVGAKVDTETYGYDPNWAKASNGVSSGRWTSAEQIRAGNPPWNNGDLRFGWGNSRHQVIDTTDNGQGPQDCTTSHPANSSCNDLCPGLQSYSITHGTQNNYGQQGEAKYYYPVQFYCAGIHAGTNTTHWNSAPPQLFEKGEAFGNCESAQTAGEAKCLQCGDKLVKCGPRVQHQYPNGGIFSYGCIYALELDKYGYDNSYRAQSREFQIIETPGTCSAMQVYVRSWGRMGSKPWGPWHIAVRNGVGDAWNRKGSACHCCQCSYPEQSGQKAPSPNYPIVVVPYNGNDGLTNCIGGGNQYAQIDAVLGTVFGMPWEHNWQHTFNTSDAAPNGLCGSGAICEPDCASCNKGACCITGAVNGPNCPSTISPDIYEGGCQGWSQQFSYNGATFGLYHPPRSVASTRMAFAIIRPDHRTYEEVDGDLVRVDKTSNYLGLPGPNGVSPARDSTQYNVCDVLAHDCPQTTNEFGECETMCSDSRDAFTQPCIRVRQDHMLHIYGSLWDPCSPFARTCLAPCDLVAENPETETPCCNPAQTNPEAVDHCCCDPTVADAQNPEYCSEGESENCPCLNDYCCDPSENPDCPCDPRLNGPCDCPGYPVWTLVPTTVKVGAAAPGPNTKRLSAKGSWQTIAGQKVWVIPDSKDCWCGHEGATQCLPWLPHDLCIDCTNHEQSYETTEDYSVTNPPDNP